MNLLRWVIVFLGLSEAGFMAFDGVRALITGEYTTPKEGPYAGKLGPWTRLVSAVGIEPRATFMKCIFVGYGVLWLGIIAGYARGAAWAWKAMLFASIGSLWYLVFGTLTSSILLALLLLRGARL